MAYYICSEGLSAVAVGEGFGYFPYTGYGKVVKDLF